MNKARPDVQQEASAGALGEDQEPDARIARSTRAMGAALSALLFEQQFDTITVQQILDRAGVARGTFYKHFRNKDDVLYSSYEGMFSAMEAHLQRPGPDGPRLMPVTEFLSHLDSSRPVMDSLRASGRMEDIWELGVGFIAAMIERRLHAAAPVPDAVSPQLAARMLSGALVEMTKWWFDHPTRATPRDLDRQFHAMARRTLPTFGLTM